MANSYSTAAACEVIPCSRHKYEKLAKALRTANPDGDPSEEIDHGFELEFLGDDSSSPDQVYLKSDASCESVTPEALPKKFLREFGKLLKGAKHKYTTIGVAETCDKLRPGTHGGYYFRITDTGELVFPTVTWPESNGNPT